LAARKYRETIKEIITFCKSKMPSSKYDKFYLDEYVKKFPKQDTIDKFLGDL